MDALPPALKARLQRVGVSLAGGELVIDPDPPVVDRWTMARAAVWTTAGVAGLDRGTAYMVSGVWELVEPQWGRQAVDTLPNRGGPRGVRRRLRTRSTAGGPVSDQDIRDRLARLEARAAEHDRHRAKVYDVWLRLHADVAELRATTAQVVKRLHSMRNQTAVGAGGSAAVAVALVEFLSHWVG